MWEKWSLKDNPYNTNPIDENTLNLFTGRQKEVKELKNTFASSNSCLILEGSRGVGTTSLMNYIRYELVKQGEHLTPDVEIAVGNKWSLERLMSNVLSSLVRAIDRRCPEIKGNEVFKEIKHATRIIEDKYKSYGAQFYIVGGQIGTSGSVTMPALIPEITLISYMKDLIELLEITQYKKGVIIHLNNLDLEENFNEVEMKHFLNMSRDLFQIKGYHWCLVGDIGLRSFISQKVDRLDDIITSEVRLEPLSIEEVKTSITNRLKYYSYDENNINAPINDEVIDYLYKITEGRLRYIFGICTRILKRISNEGIIQTVDMKFAKPLISIIVKERFKNDITKYSWEILKIIIRKEKINPTQVAKILKKKRESISREMNKLVDKKILVCEQVGTRKMYSLSLEAKIAYKDLNG